MRRSRLKADPEKVRAWQRRSAVKAAENARQKAAENARQKPRPPLERRSTLSAKGKGRVNPPRPGEAEERREGPLTPAEWREEVWRRCRGRCVMCRRRVPLAADHWCWQAHHCVEKGVLRARRQWRVVWDPDNGVVTCRRCHERHTTRTEVIPAERLPRYVRAFAERLGPWAVAVLDRSHPPAAGTCGDETTEDQPHG